MEHGAGPTCAHCLECRGWVCTGNRYCSEWRPGPSLKCVLMEGPIGEGEGGGRVCVCACLWIFARAIKYVSLLNFFPGPLWIINEYKDHYRVAAKTEVKRINEVWYRKAETRKLSLPPTTTEARSFFFNTTDYYTRRTMPDHSRWSLLFKHNILTQQ